MMVMEEVEWSGGCGSGVCMLVCVYVHVCVVILIFLLMCELQRLFVCCILFGWLVGFLSTH